MVPREYPGDAVEEARPVARHDRQHLVGAALVGPDVDRRRDREVAHAARKAAATRRREGRVRTQLFGQLGFDHGDAILVVRVAPLAHHDESVERIAVARRVDLRFRDVEGRAIEVAADAGEKRLAVLRIDHHLQAFAERRKARLHHRLLGIDAVVEVPRMPGDLLSVVAQEVGDVEACPEPIFHPVG